MGLTQSVGLLAGLSCVMFATGCAEERGGSSRAASAQRVDQTEAQRDSSTGASLGAFPAPRQGASESVGASESDVNRQFDERLREIAGEYQKWSCVTPMAKRAPALCRAVTARDYTPERSRSGDLATHGSKLYYLYVRMRDSYYSVHVNADDAFQGSQSNTSPVGQALVKESWVPVEVDGGTYDGIAGTQPQEGMIITAADGKRYRLDSAGPLFIMFKMDAVTPGTDQGWVYGTVMPDRKTITSRGRVASCMECHAEGTQDRLFGLK
jgi:hypothetical protein